MRRFIVLTAAAALIPVVGVSMTPALGAPPGPPPTVSIADAASVDAGGTAEFSVTLSEASSKAVNVHYATADNSAVAPGDYAASSGVVIFNPGETAETVTVTTNGDDDEQNETFFVNLSSPANATLDDSQGVGTILGIPPAPPPTVSISDATPIDEGSIAEFSVTLSGAAASEVTVNYATANNTAAAPGDYTTKSGIVTFTPGDTAETITVATNSDDEQEATETFHVNLTDPVNATIADGQGVGTILDATPDGGGDGGGGGGDGGGGGGGGEPDPVHTVGLVDSSQGIWHLYDSNGVELRSFYYGNPGDYPFLGDWDCDGDETPGLYRQSDGYVYLRNSNTQGVADIRFFFGDPGDIPIAGDFNNDGCDTVSIYRPSEARFYIINQLGSNDGGLGAAEFSFLFGNLGDKPVVGDWDGDGIDEIGLHRESTGFFYFRNTLTTGVADDQFYFGNPADRFVAGDWGVVDGTDTPAVFRPSNTTMYFRHSNTQGVADSQWSAGQSGWLPVAGNTGLT